MATRAAPPPPPLHFEWVHCPPRSGVPSRPRSPATDRESTELSIFDTAARPRHGRRTRGWRREGLFVTRREGGDSGERERREGAWSTISLTSRKVHFLSHLVVSIDSLLFPLVRASVKDDFGHVDGRSVAFLASMPRILPSFSHGTMTERVGLPRSSTSPSPLCPV